MSDLRRLRPIRRGTIVTIHPLEGAGRRERIRVNGIVTSTTGLQWYAGQSVLDGTGRLFQPEDIVRRNPNYADVLQARRELKEKLRGTPLMYSVALERWLGDDEDKEDLVISAVNQMLRQGWQKAALDHSRSLVITRHGTAKPYYSVLLQSSRSNPSKRASLRTREGTRVRFDPTPASALLYSNPPRVGEEGYVTRVSVPGKGRTTSIPGPGGGLLYVMWDRSGTQGVSPMDLNVVTKGKACFGCGAPTTTLASGGLFCASCDSPIRRIR